MPKRKHLRDIRVGDTVWFAIDGGELSDMTVRPFQGTIISSNEFVWGPDNCNKNSLDDPEVYSSYEEALKHMKEILLARLERGRRRPFTDEYRPWVIKGSLRALREKHSLTIEDHPDDSRLDLEGDADQCEICGVETAGADLCETCIEKDIARQRHDNCPSRYS
jgi:hypothetical protein